MNKSEHEIIHDHFSKLGKESHRVSPRSKKFYSDIGKKSAAKRKAMREALMTK